ncbi:unnamed protein product [Allacma fusca]|uniref:Uncharacterized protein n=1 Tax=Allacma fusca TaxID=39272 RepID=A0A8J2PED9_9HEXA|nr:unnamed protein product [Allacma fusca]
MCSSRYIVFCVLLTGVGLLCISAELLPIGESLREVKQPQVSPVVKMIQIECLVCHPICWARCGTRRFKRCCLRMERLKRGGDFKSEEISDSVYEKP